MGENPHGWTCPDDEQIRELFGCDGAALGQGWISRCVRCVAGECGGCDGGYVYHRRCPSHVVGDARIRRAVESWVLLKNHRTWPKSGGTDDQEAWTVEAIRFLDGELSQHEARQRKRDEARLNNGRSKARA